MTEATRSTAGTSVPAPARPGAHPVKGRRLPASLFFARLTARTGPRGAHTIHRAARSGTLADVRARKRALLVSFKRDGTPVPTPVWAAAGADGRLYVRTERTAGKVKRLRRDPRLLLAPCTMRGRPLGAPFEACARVLEPVDEPRGEQALAARYGFGRALFEWTMDRLRVDMCFLEITAAAWDATDDARARAISPGDRLVRETLAETCEAAWEVKAKEV